MTEYTNVADREIGGADMAVDIADETGANRLRQLEISVGPVAARRLGPGDLLPMLTIARRLKHEFGVDVGSIRIAARLVVGEIDLDSTDRVDTAKVDREHLSWLVPRGHPEGLGIFVGDPPSREISHGRGSGGVLAVGQEH